MSVTTVAELCWMLKNARPDIEADGRAVFTRSNTQELAAFVLHRLGERVGVEDADLG